MSDSICLREVFANDSSLLARLHAETFPESPWTANWFTNALTPPPVQAFLSEVAAEPTGFAAISIVEGEAEILTFGVIPQFRRYGYGKALLDHLEEVVVSASVAKIFLEVAEGNQSAIMLYQKVGYCEVGRRKKYYASGEDALVLAKNLSL